MFANQAILLCLLVVTPLRTTKEVDMCARLGFVGFMISMLFAYVMGGVWRFGEVGKFASGDDLPADVAVGGLYQVANAKFLSIFYLISWILLGTYVALACTCQNLIVKRPKNNFHDM